MSLLQDVTTAKQGSSDVSLRGLSKLEQRGIVLPFILLPLLRERSGQIFKSDIRRSRLVTTLTQPNRAMAVALCAGAYLIAVCVILSLQYLAGKLQLF